MEDETSGKGSTLILGRLFLMTARTKIDMHARTLSMEFSDTLVLGSIIEEADYEEVHNLPNSEDNNNDIADLEFEAELLEVSNQACKWGNPECVNRAEVKVAETKKPFSAQLATIFTAETESTKRGRDEEKTGVNSAE
ncbi:hypothetical protein CR513_45358, partial [Mucuna pruriens]